MFKNTYYGYSDENENGKKVVYLHNLLGCLWT